MLSYGVLYLAWKSCNPVKLIEISQIQGVKFSSIDKFHDFRGTFIKTSPDDFLEGKEFSIALSLNPKAGTIRGIHFQIEPFAEEKLISCIQGSTFEIIIDLRPDSVTCGQIATFELSEQNNLQVYLPKGIAHGFQTITSNTIVHYCLTSEFSRGASFAINPLDDINIEWPISDYLISDKDSQGISLETAILRYSQSTKA